MSETADVSKQSLYWLQAVTVSVRVLTYCCLLAGFNIDIVTLPTLARGDSGN